MQKSQKMKIIRRKRWIQSTYSTYIISNKTDSETVIAGAVEKMEECSFFLNLICDAEYFLIEIVFYLLYKHPCKFHKITT